LCNVTSCNKNFGNEPMTIDFRLRDYVVDLWLARSAYFTVNYIKEKSFKLIRDLPINDIKWLV
jgi:hypothetical protein